MNKFSMSFIRLFTALILCFLMAPGPRPAAQDDSSRLKVNVDLVQLSIAVTDRKGSYVTGLKPDDFVITEDKIPEKIANFEESSKAMKHAEGTPPPQSESSQATPSQVVPNGNAQAAADSDSARPSSVSGTSIFILFDTSNYMYKGFVYAQDAICDFVRSLDDVNRLAFYSYSRNLSRAALLTSDHYRVVNGVRSTVAGDDAALYNSLLMTVNDSAHITGKKAIVVFSNGPDNASSVPPEDVAELAQSTGTIIYIVSTRLAEQEPISAAAFARMSKATGGKAYFAGNWTQEKQAFAAIRDDLGHLYTINYYPQPNPNRGWRSISVKLVGKEMQKYHVRTRDGYALIQSRAGRDAAYATSAPEIDVR